MWSHGAETLRVKLPLKLPFPLNTPISTGYYFACSLPQNTEKHEERARNEVSPRGSGGIRWRGRQDRESYPFYYFQMFFPQEHRGAFINPRVWTPFKLREQIPPLPSRDFAPRLRLARPRRSWPGDGGLIDTTCTVAALPTALSPGEPNPIGTLKTKRLPRADTVLPFEPTEGSARHHGTRPSPGHRSEAKPAPSPLLARCIFTNRSNKINPWGNPAGDEAFEGGIATPK